MPDLNDELDARGALLQSAWNRDVGCDLHLTGFTRRVGRFVEARCSHESRGWSFSYLAPTPEAAFAGLTEIVHRHTVKSGSPARYAHR